MFWSALGGSGHGSPEPLPTIGAKLNFSLASLSFLGSWHQTNPESDIRSEDDWFSTVLPQQDRSFAI
jgi:hypothetical protein